MITARTVDLREYGSLNQLTSLIALLALDAETRNGVVSSVAECGRATGTET